MKAKKYEAKKHELFLWLNNQENITEDQKNKIAEFIQKMNTALIDDQKESIEKTLEALKKYV